MRVGLVRYEGKGWTVTCFRVSNNCQAMGVCKVLGVILPIPHTGVDVTGAELNVKITHNNNVAFFLVDGNCVRKFVNNILKRLNRMVC